VDAKNDDPELQVQEALAVMRALAAEARLKAYLASPVRLDEWLGLESQVRELEASSRGPSRATVAPIHAVTAKLRESLPAAGGGAVCRALRALAA
jgi:hypothetical protein